MFTRLAAGFKMTSLAAYKSMAGIENKRGRPLLVDCDRSTLQSDRHEADSLSVMHRGATDQPSLKSGSKRQSIAPIRKAPNGALHSNQRARENYFLAAGFATFFGAAAFGAIFALGATGAGVDAAGTAFSAAR